MNIHIKQTEQQQKKALTTYRKYKNQGISFFWFILFFLCSFITYAVISDLEELELLDFSIIIVIILNSYFIYFTAQIILNNYNFKKKLKAYSYEIIFNKESIEIIYLEEKRTYQWKSIKQYTFYENILMLTFFENEHHLPLLINLDEESTEYIIDLKSKLNIKLLPTIQKRENKLNTFDYFYLILSLIPFIGIVFAIITFINGIQKKSWLLKLFPFLSLVSTILSTNLIIDYTKNITRDSESWIEFNENDLNKTLAYLENYKLDNGVYPDSLGSLKKYDAFIFFNEIPNNEPFYYEKITDSTFYLFAKGKDKTPFTSDDIYPPNGYGSIQKINGIIIKTE